LGRANKSLAAHQQMRRWVRWEDRDFPRTSTRKVIRRTVVERIRPSLTDGRPAEATAGSLVALIARLSGRPPLRTDAGANLTTDLMLDSLASMQLLAELEDRYQITLDESRFTAATTLGDLHQMLASRAQAEPASGPAPAPELPVDHVYPKWPLSWPVRVFRWAWLQLLAMPAAILMAHPRVEGKDKLKSLKSPCLLVSNHQTEADAGLIIYGLPYRMRWRLAIAMSGELLTAMRKPPSSMPRYQQWYEKLCYYLAVAIFNVFPLPQRSGFRQSFAHAGRLMDKGYSVLVFPEGRRARDENLQPFQTGVGMLAQGLGTPVVPVCIRGLATMRNENRRFARSGEAVVRFGEPITFAPDASAQQITERLETAVRLLER